MKVSQNAWNSTFSFLSEHSSELSDLTLQTSDGSEVSSCSILYPLDSLDTFSTPSLESPSVRIISNEQVWAQLSRHDQQSTALKSHYGHGDYTLRISNQSIPVHRVLLHQIPYFQSLFNPAFPSSTAFSTDLPEDIFTPSAAQELVKFLYTPCLAIPTESGTPLRVDEACESRLDTSELLNLFRAADFLRFSELEEEVMSQLQGNLADKEVAIAAATEVLSSLVRWEIADVSERPRELVTAAIDVLAAHPGGWKKPIVDLPEDSRERLLARTKDRAQDSLGALKLWSSVRKLQDGVDKSRSKIKDFWAERVFEPLLKHAAQVAADGIEDGVLKARFKKAVTAKRDIGELLAAVVKEGMAPKNALGMWKTAEEVGGEMKAQAVKWMKQKWMEIVLENGGFSKAGWSLEERKRVAIAIGRKLEDLD